MRIGRGTASLTASSRAPRIASGTDMNMFIGMTVQLGENGPVGRIDSTFGKTKFKCVFAGNERGVEGLQEACHKAKLLLNYKRFVFDPEKKMIQS